MIRRLIYSMLMALPRDYRLAFAKARFRKARETFYEETKLDVATKGLRNRETLLERLRTLEKRHRERSQIVWIVYHEIGRRMVAGEPFARAMKPFIPLDEFALLDLAGKSTKEDAAERGLDLAGMAANAKRILSDSTSMQMAYPAFLLVYLYGLCMIFGGAVFPQILEVKPLNDWMPYGRMLYAIDTFCYDYWWLSGSVVGLAVFAYFATIRRWTGELRNRVDNAPLMWRNRRDLRGALLIVSLAGLFDSNLTLRAAIDQLMENADPWLRWHLERMSRRLTATPHQPMRALDTGIFSEIIVDKITDAAGRDQFIDAIKSLGRTSLSRVVEAVRRNARITHYILMGIAVAVFVGVGVGSYVATGAASFDIPTPSVNGSSISE
ncbi:type II secretion system protein [Paraburkholderia largidicola]|uniref:Type II secretion system protein n=1 Tax=Paraburkholderia largidicola TaxID=3014751 RepID=A0A7I8C267_9BURK|nr:type II secretion system protein [Paraburkholderia sp. PGU16]BCF95132.1 hypothetical protein PPGU16_81990 [Paraburkholderia sp. PGU16]